MIRVFVILLLSCLSVVSRGAGLWENEVKCVVELATVKTVIEPSSFNSPFEFVQWISLVRDESSSKKISRGKGFFDLGDGFQIRFKLKFEEGASDWLRGADRLLVKAWFIKKGNDGEEIKVYDFNERTSDETDNFYRLGLARDQDRYLLTFNYMVNNQVVQLLLNNDLEEGAMIELVREKLLDVKTPYSADLSCELWRPGLRQK